MKVGLDRQGRRFSYLMVLAPVVFFLFTAISAFAQLPTGTILGVVKDSSGAVVAGAIVTVRNVDTGGTRTAPTEGEGSYRFAALPTGNYEVQASHEGFQTTRQSQITLSVGQEVVENITLEVGSTTQSIEVTTEAPLVNTTNGTLGQVVDEQKVEDLPLNGRNYEELNMLQPGITRLEVGGVTSAGSGGNFEFSSNGAPVRSNSYLLDGAPLVNLFGLSTSSVGNTTLGIDGIKEFRTVTNSFSAEYGLVMGSVMTMVSKNGTNRFHGDAFEYLRNSAMDAANFFDTTPINFPGKRIAPLRRNQFGGALGGPIRKDKTFFFATYEGLRQLSGNPIIQTVFQTSCYSPTTHLILVTGLPTSCGATSSSKLGAPAGTVAPVVQPFLQFYPYPNLPPAAAGGLPRYGSVFPTITNEDFGEVRVDHNLSSTDSFFLRYTIDNTNFSTATNPPFPSVASGKAQFATLAETHIFSPTLLNTGRVSLSSFPNSQSSNTPGQPPCVVTKNNCFSNNSIPGTSLVCSSAYGAVTGNPPTGPGCLQMGSVSITGISPSIGYGLTNQEQDMNTISVSDDVFYTRGKHAFKFGTLINRYQMNINEEIQQGGSVTFTSIANFFAGLAGSATSTAYTLLDPNHSNGRRYYRFDSVGFYGQDDIRLTPRLTVNIGLRYEFGTVPSEKYGTSAAFLHLSTTDTANSYVFGPPWRNPSLLNFSPRVGFAWDVFGNGKTSLRGGFGELYDIGNVGSALIQEAIGLPPYNYSFAFSPGPIALQLPLAIPANYIPAVHLVDYYQNQPHMLMYNLSVERQLPARIALTVSYAGSRGLNLWQELDANPKAPYPGTTTEWPVAGNKFFTANHENPNLASVQDWQTHGNSYYNSLQVGLLKQLSHNLQFQSAYTYSHSIDNWQSQIGTEGITSDPLNARVDRGPSNWDVRHYWRFNMIYTLPDFTDQRILGAFINGWRLSGIEALTSGYPFNPVMNTNTSGSGVNNAASGVDRPSLSPTFTGNLYPHTVGEWFDPAAFIPAPNIQTPDGPVGVIGNVGRNSLRGPRISNLDFSISKQQKVAALGEGGAVEVRVETFNIFNHPNFATPATNAAYNGTSVAGSAGQISATAPGTDSRRLQLALRVLF